MIESLFDIDHNLELATFTVCLAWLQRRWTRPCVDCKHVAAVLYGVGARLDHSPELLFRLRAVDETEMLSNLEAALPDRRTQRDGTNTLSGDDLAALFDLDMAEGEAPAVVPPAAAASVGSLRKSDKSAKAKASKPPRGKARGH
jgi:uncharacterized Zn finger protein